MMSDNWQRVPEFFSLLFESDDLVTIACKAPGQSCLSGAKTKPRDEALAYAEYLHKNGQQVFFGVLPRKSALPDRKTGRKDECHSGHVVWVDIDNREGVLQRLQDFSPSPSLIIDSGNGYHAYWLLNDECSLETIERINQVLAQNLEADKSGWDCSQLLRLPGSLNLKDPQSPKPCTVIELHRERRYAVNELPQAEEPPSKQRKAHSLKSQSSARRQATQPTSSLSPRDQAYRNFTLLGFVEKLPGYIRRMIAQGEYFDPKAKKETWGVDRSKLAFHLVLQLHNQGWPSPLISELLTSRLPLRGLALFQEKYQGREEEAVTAIISKVQQQEQAYGNALPRLLDINWWLGERMQVAVDLTWQTDLGPQKPALHRLWTSAQALYDHPQQGHFLASLTMGYGKTREFLLPFVIHCARQSSNKGVIVAMERRRDVKAAAQHVNEAIGRTVAVALFSHDPDDCPADCDTHHKEDAALVGQCPMLFITHERLARREVEPYRTWANGDRVLCLIDEKPSAWWGKGYIAEQDLVEVQTMLASLGKSKYRSLHAILQEARTLLGQARETFTAVRVRTKLTAKQCYAVLVEGQQSRDERDRLQPILDNLLALSESGGVTIAGYDKDEEEGDGSALLVVSRHRPLPPMPTIILDATGYYDPEYAPDIKLLAISPWEGKPIAEIFHPSTITVLSTDRNITKHTLSHDEDAWRQIVTQIHQLLEQLPPNDQIYIVIAKQHEETLTQRLSEHLSAIDFQRLILNHYGNTKGSNAMRDAAAIVFASIQFKSEGYYRALALTTNLGDPTSPTYIRGQAVRTFRDPDLEALKGRDTVITLLQEIGRTRIREGRPVTVFLPWADAQGVEALKDQLGFHFYARINHRMFSTKAPTNQDRLLALLSRPGTYPKDELMTSLGTTRGRLRELLNREMLKKELWGREVQITQETVNVPAGTVAARLLTEAEAWCWKELNNAPLRSTPFNDDQRQTREASDNARGEVLVAG